MMGLLFLSDVNLNKKVIFLTSSDWKKWRITKNVCIDSQIWEMACMSYSFLKYFFCSLGTHKRVKYSFLKYNLPFFRSEEVYF